jgi:hypothetical protein
VPPQRGQGEDDELRAEDDEDDDDDDDPLGADLVPLIKFAYSNFFSYDVGVSVKFIISDGIHIITTYS